MPNLRLEYTDNVQLDVPALLRELHQALAATGHINLKGLRSQATRLTEYVIADGHESYQHLMLTLTLMEGRPHEVRSELAQRMMAVLDAHFGHLRESQGLSLMVDVQEMTNGILHIHHNIPAGGWQDGGVSAEFIRPIPTTIEAGIAPQLITA